MSNELIVVEIEKESVQSVFTSPDKLKPILDEIAAKAKSIVPDASTAKGRKEIASVAYQVARSKTYLDGLGKDLVSEMKKLPSLVDASRKQMREFLDELSLEVRKPLTDWEEEQARIEAEKKAKEAAEALAKKIEDDHEIAILMNREFDRLAVERKEQTEKAQKERDAHLVAAAEQVAREAARRETEAAAAAVEKANREKLEAEARAIKAQMDAAENAERARQEGIANERRRVEAEKKRAEEEEAKRQKSTSHRALINRVAMMDFQTLGFTEEQAKSIVIAIAKGHIHSVSIQY